MRVYKTRSVATDACRAGSVKVNGIEAKPSRDVKEGERVEAKIGLICRTLVVKGLPRSRVGAAKVSEYCEDQTPPEEYEKARKQPVQQFLAREKGSGRPTKRDRRLLDQLFGQQG